MTSPNRFDYLPLINRPIIRWPENARIALWIVPNLEHYEFLPQVNPTRNQWPRTPHPDVASYSHRDYGNRVAFWRMLEVMDQYKVRCTVSLNAAVMDHFTEIRDAMVDRNWDYMSHGIYNTRYLNQMSMQEERAFYQECILSLKKHTGKQLKGMLTPAVSPTNNSPDLMAEAGLIYHADWFCDDQPFPLSVRSGRLISIPYAIDLNDGTFNRFGCPPEYWARCLKDQFDILYEEGASNGMVMCVSLHPYICAHPSRIKLLDEVIGYMMSHSRVWQATGDDIAQYYMDNYYDTVSKFLKTQQHTL